MKKFRQVIFLVLIDKRYEMTFESVAHAKSYLWYPLLPKSCIDVAFDAIYSLKYWSKKLWFIFQEPLNVFAQHQNVRETKKPVAKPVTCAMYSTCHKMEEVKVDQRRRLL